MARKKNNQGNQQIPQDAKKYLIYNALKNIEFYNIDNDRIPIDPLIVDIETLLYRTRTTLSEHIEKIIAKIVDYVRTNSPKSLPLDNTKGKILVANELYMDFKETDTWDQQRWEKQLEIMRDHARIKPGIKIVGDVWDTMTTTITTNEQTDTGLIPEIQANIDEEVEESVRDHERGEYERVWAFIDSEGFEGEFSIEQLMDIFKVSESVMESVIENLEFCGIVKLKYHWVPPKERVFRKIIDTGNVAFDLTAQ